MGSPAQEAGRFSDEDAHQVCVGAFHLGKHEITVARYAQFAAATGRTLPDGNDRSSGSFPVVNVTRIEATAYGQWLSEQTGLTFRLPTEAEWEYAARAGTQTACASGGAGDGGLGCGQGQGTLAAVGQSIPNAFGLHDMTGNVREWTCSDYMATYGGRESRCAMPASPLQGVARGAAWSSTARETRVAKRTVMSSANVRDPQTGFRILLIAPSEDGNSVR